MVLEYKFCIFFVEINMFLFSSSVFSILHCMLAFMGVHTFTVDEFIGTSSSN